MYTNISKLIFYKLQVLALQIYQSRIQDTLLEKLYLNEIHVIRKYRKTFLHMLIPIVSILGDSVGAVVE